MLFAKFSLLQFPGNQVRGTSPPNMFPLDLEEPCHGFRPVVVAAEVELDDYREPGQLVIACKKQQCMYLSPFFFNLAPNHPKPQLTHTQARARKRI